MDARRRAAVLVAAVLVAGLAPSAQAAPARVQAAQAAPGPTEQIGPGGVVPLPPWRLLDTRDGTGTGAGGGRGAATALGPGATLALQVTGRGGVPATGVSAVVLNVTAVSPTAPGYVTAWPQGTARPTASNLNFVAGQVVPNLVTVRVGTGGAVDLVNGSLGSTHLVADIAGYVLGAPGANGGAPTLTAPGALASVAPARVLDTREGGGPLGPGAVRTLQATGRGGVPARGVAAVVLNLTAVTPTASGYVTAWPRLGTRPTASNLNFTAGQVVPNLVTVKVGPTGQIDLVNGSLGSTHLVADVAGYVLPGRAGGTYVPSPLDGAAFFDGMDCVAADDCVAAGYESFEPGSDPARARIHELGTADAARDLPLPADADPGAESYTSGVGCDTEATCSVVGAYARQDGTWSVFASTRTAATWSAAALTNPSASESHVPGRTVDCAASVCTVVTHGYPGASDAVATPLVHRLAGGSWTSAALPLPQDVGDDLYLQDLACPTAASCTAVGRYRTDADQERLATWSLVGGAWKVDGTVLAGVDPALSYVDASLDCWDAQQCALGLTYSRAGLDPVALLGRSSSPGAWLLTSAGVPPAAPGTFQNVGLGSVDCGASSTCVLVGTVEQMAQNGTTTATPLVRRLAGGTWQAEQVAGNGSLGQVSCADATTCTAIGADGTGAPVLAERTSGGWTRTDLTWMPGLWLAEVSCPHGGGCTLVGSTGSTEGGGGQGFVLR